MNGAGKASVALAEQRGRVSSPNEAGVAKEGLATQSPRDLSLFILKAVGSHCTLRRRGMREEKCDQK